MSWSTAPGCSPCSATWRRSSSSDSTATSLFRAYESVEFLAPVAGDYVEATRSYPPRNTSRKIRFEARKVISNLRAASTAASAADVLAEPVVVARAVGTCVTPASCSEGRAGSTCRACHPGPPRRRSPSSPGGRRGRHPDGGHRRGRADARANSICPSPRRRSRTRQHAAGEAGAAVIHLHVRNADGSNTQSSAIRRGHRRDSPEVRLRHPALHRRRRRHVHRGAIGPFACKPEMATLNCGTINFGDDVFVNSRGDIREARGERSARGGRPPRARMLRGRARGGGAGPGVRGRHRQAPSLPVRARREGRHPGPRGAVPAHPRSVGRELGRGGDGALAATDDRAGDAARGPCRIGLEDNIYLGKGLLSEGSAPLVAGPRPTRARYPGGPPRTPSALASCSGSLHARADGPGPWSPRSRSSPTMTPVRAYAALRRAAGNAALVPPRERRRWRAMGRLLDPRLRAQGRGHAARRRGLGRRQRRAPRDDGRGRGEGPRSRPRARCSPPRPGRRALDPPGSALRSHVGYIAWDLVHAIDRVPGWGSRATAPLARFFERDHRDSCPTR